jgi:hypothetical protein
MTTLGALFYADARSLVNQMREIRLAPGRAILWLFFALVVAGMIVLRTFNASNQSRFPRHLSGNALIVDLLVCGGIAAFGIMLAFGDRYAGLFAHPAEARFIIDSPAKPFLATLYVQTRQIIRGGARQAIGLLYIAVVYLPATLPAADLVRDLVLIAAAAGLLAAIPLARQLLARPLVPLAAAAGIACVLLACVPLLRYAAFAFSGGFPSLAVFAGHLPAWHPGNILLASAGTQYMAIALVLACTCALFAYVALAARDAYPELYELSMKRIARAERLRARPFAWALRTPSAPARAKSRAASAGAPAGVAIFVWRAWTEYRRTNTAQSTGLETALALGAGYALARITHFVAADVLIAFASPFVNIVFIIAVMRSALLATELRRPLFWLSGATLFERLCALGLAQGWRLIGWCALGAVGLAAGGAAAALVVAVLIAGPAGVLLAGAIGYASYALLPNDIDQRGPLLFLRLFLGYVLIVPPVAAGIVIGLFVRAPVVAVSIAAATTLLEAAVLVGFAAWRLDRMSIVLR